MALLAPLPAYWRLPGITLLLGRRPYDLATGRRVAQSAGHLEPLRPARAKEKIEKGADFGKMAKRFSTCASAKRCGDLGEFNKGDMVKPFDYAVFKGELLKVLGPVRTKFGFHLIKVLYRN